MLYEETVHCAKCTVDCALCTTDYGLCAVRCGLWTVQEDYVLCRVLCEKRSALGAAEKRGVEYSTTEKGKR